MKILYFSNTPGIGSEFLNRNFKLKASGGWLYALSQVIKDKIDLSLAFHYPYKIEAFQYNRINFYPIYTGNIIFENLTQWWLNKVYDKEYLPKYLKIIETVKPDIIHIHGTENSYSCIIDQVKIPVVVSIQGNLTVIFHKYRSGFIGKFMRTSQPTFELKHLLLGTTNFYKVYKKFGKMAEIEQGYLKKTKYIIGRTDWDRRITRVLAPDSSYFVGNEILRDSFYKSVWEPRNFNGKVIIHTTNGNSYYKGFETLCHALHLLNVLGIDVEWRVAGITTDSLINKITKKHLKDNYPKKGLKLLGSLDEKELVHNLKESNIYVMPSHIENSPNNLCEAMILGMPCIATYAGGTGSLLKDGDEGILIQDGDPWAMAGAIVELIKYPDKAQSYGQNARKRALHRHNKERVVNQYLDIYRNIIKVHQYR